MDRKITITIDGKNIPLNPFLKEMTVNLIAGFMKTLKNTNSDGEIVFKLEKKQ